MDKIELPNVTLVGIDCVDLERLQKAMDISETGIDFGAVKLLSSITNNDPRWVEIPPLHTIEAYSEFCIRNLTEYVDTDYVLLVQWDGFILNPQSWSDKFLEYDYIGAPIHIDEREFWFSKFKLPRSMVGKAIIGNGGFCLRSKKLLDLSARFAGEGIFNEYQPEDLRLCFFEKEYFVKEGMQYAPYEIASVFSLEGRALSYGNQFGFHGFDWTDISKWVEENPECGIEQIMKE